MQVFSQTILVVTVIIVVAVLGIYTGFRRISVAEITNRSISTLRLTQDVFESVYSWLVPSFSRLISDPVVRASMYGTDLNIVDYTDMAQRVNSLVSMSSLIHSAYVYNPSEEIVFSTVEGIEIGSISDPALLDVIRQATLYRDPVFIPRYLDLGFEVERVLSFVVYEPTFHESPLDGCIVVNISEPEMRRMFIEGNSAVNPNLIIVNREGIVLTHHDPDLFAVDVRDNRAFHNVFASDDSIIQYPLDEDPGQRVIAVKRRPMGWTFITILDETSLYSSLIAFRNAVLIVLAGTVILASILIYTTSYFLTRPVVQLFQHAKRLAVLEHNDRIVDSAADVDTDSDTAKRPSEIAFLDSVLEDFGSRIATLTEYLNESREVHRDEALRTVILQQTSPVDPLLKDLPTRLQGARKVRVDVVRLDNYHALLEATDLSGVHAILEGLAKLATQVRSDGASWAVRCGDDHLAIVHRIESETTTADQLRNHYRTLVARFQERFSHSVSIGIGQITTFPEMVHTGYENALEVTDYRFRHGPGAVLSSDDVTASSEYEYPDRIGVQIADELLLGHRSDAVEKLDEFFRIVSQGGYEDFRISVQILYHTIAKRVGDRNRPEVRVLGEEIRWSETITDTRRLFWEFFSDLFLSMESSRNQQSEETMETIREVVERNLQDPGLCSEQIADSVDLSVAYVRELFKKYSGESLPGYIQERRMELARKLLTTTRESVKAIAETCGFQSYNYFFTAFKRSHGVTPKEYRKANVS